MPFQSSLIVPRGLEADALINDANSFIVCVCVKLAEIDKVSLFLNYANFAFPDSTEKEDWMISKNKLSFILRIFLFDIKNG